MIDIKLIRENPDLVRENIRKKFQDHKLPLVDQAAELDRLNRACISEASELRAARNTLSKQIGMLMGQAKKDPAKAAEAEKVKAQVQKDADRLQELEKLENEYSEKLRQVMYQIPQIIDDSVPIGKDDSMNVEVQRFGEPRVPNFPIPYHTEIMESFNGIDLDGARRVAGNGFYYLIGDIARLHEAVLAYARDFMIGKGFTYMIPPFMMHGNVVEGVMSFPEMDAMMYKIEGEDLYLIGTSEHSMIGRYIDQIIPEESLPHTLTSYSPCFRKEKGAHGIEERGVYRIHQFEKQEMIVVCKPEDSMAWY
ncbi:MAG: serine--tRNA ligase, partial [Oscillospiraceae bacterium]|nr:serine--tRNA ligase [Oscillospiraceae bacterium]